MTYIGLGGPAFMVEATIGAATRDLLAAMNSLNAGSNDNTPCTLPDGRVVSLSLERPRNSASVHELKVRARDGRSYLMWVSGADIQDVSLGCSQ